jgi:tRNA threonylcarbamoyl adenosine modification protein YeaZ
MTTLAYIYNNKNQEKNKYFMNHYLVLQYPYETIQIALCNNGTILQQCTEHKFKAIGSTIPNIQALLKAQNLTLSDIKFIAINVGPGPYNTLRALLTMVNGIHFVTKIPIISISALQLLELEHPSKNSLVILQAFADNVFYRLKIDGKITESGCSIHQLIDLINQESTTEKILTLGNGAQVNQELLAKSTTNLIFSDPIPAFNSLQILASTSYAVFENKAFNNAYAKPIYFDDLTSKY